MSAPESRISILAGETPIMQFGTITDSAGSPLNLTGAVLTFVISNADRVNVLVKKTIGAGITIPMQSGAAIGTFQVQLNVIDTSKLSGEYYFEAGIVISGVAATCAFGPMDIGKTTVR